MGKNRDQIDMLAYRDLDKHFSSYRSVEQACRDIETRHRG